MYTEQEKEKIHKTVYELIEKSFEIDDIIEKRDNPVWAIVTYILHKYNQGLKADVVIPMRPGKCLGPHFSWKPEDISDLKNMDIL